MDRPSREQLEQNVLAAAAHARRVEESGRDCTKADEVYMDAVFALHDHDFEQGTLSKNRRA